MNAHQRRVRRRRIGRLLAGPLATEEALVFHAALTRSLRTQRAGESAYIYRMQPLLERIAHNEDEP